MSDESKAQSSYWNKVAAEYQSSCRIAVEDFHYGPLLPGESRLHLLPKSVEGLHCLELGSGAGQNSIYLASRGARCVALDVSASQLAAGRELAVGKGVNVDFHEAAMEDAFPVESATYDLVHSVFALPFTHHPENMIRTASRLLRDDGWLVLSTAHPLFAFEWLEIDGEGMGGFVTDYFRPPDDERDTDDGTIASRSWPVSRVADWLTDSGFVITRLAEPLPLDPADGTPPYTSNEWEALRPQLQRIPSAVIYVARKSTLRP